MKIVSRKILEETVVETSLGRFRRLAEDDSYEWMHVGGGISVSYAMQQSLEKRFQEQLAREAAALSKKGTVISSTSEEEDGETNEL